MAAKKALVIVRGGVACAYADPGVDVAVIDIDNLMDAKPEDIVPVHASFRHLAGTLALEIENLFSDSDMARQTDAEYLMADR